MAHALFDSVIAQGGLGQQSRAESMVASVGVSVYGAFLLAAPAPE